ncbi:Sorting nexin-18 [Armadillidium vulgare]|nr:Sorting nexin-18 [Armadillidium vulgare]
MNDWDDEWDDDDSEPGTLNTNGTSMYGFPQPKHIVKQTNSISDISGLGKFNVDDIDKVFIDDDGTAPYWRTVGIEFSCSITSPKKESKFHGMKSFIAYTITPSDANTVFYLFKFTNQPVSRRYKHFDWLHDRLSVKFSMIPIPPLPEKQISGHLLTGRFEDDLIEYRMTMLQSWIDRICHHPVLGQCDVLKHFLTCPNDEKTWKAGKRKAESDKLVGVNFYQAVQRPDVPLDVAITENKLESYNRFFSHLDEATKLLQGTCVDQIKKHQGAFKREYTKISHSFSKLSRAFDMDPSNSDDAYQEIGTIFEQEPKHDWEPLSNLLYEYKGLIDGFPSIISAAKNSIGIDTKIPILEKDAQEGKADIDQLPPVINRSDTVVYALHAEVTNFHHQRQRDFKNAMTSFLTEQISFYQKVADQLRDTLQHFNEI